MPRNELMVFGMKKELTVAADVKLLDTVMDFISALLAESGCDAGTENRIALSVEELFVNIASYAYEDGGDVTLTVQCIQDSVSITFCDSGKPFNPLEKSDPDIRAAADLRPIGGLGIFLAKKLMDSVGYEYRDGKNILTLMKKISVK